MAYLDQYPTGRQIAAARALLGMNQSLLAERANISVPTLKRMEASEGPAAGVANNVLVVRRVLETAGVEFTNGGQPGVRMKSAAARAGEEPPSTSDEAALPDIPETDGEPYDGAPV